MLKWLALILMLLDHIGYYFYFLMPLEVYTILRAVGRLSFPIFCYYIVLGYRRSSNLNGYITRVAFFAVAGQLLLNLSGELTGIEPVRSVLFTLLAGLLLIFGVDLIFHSSRDMIALMKAIPADVPSSSLPSPDFGVKVNLRGISLPAWQGFIYGVLLIIGAGLIVGVIQPDYSWYGLLTILLFYLLDWRQPDMALQGKRETSREVMLWLFSYLALNLVYAYINVSQGSDWSWGLLQSLSVLAVPLFPLHRQDKKPRTQSSKYFFYIFYPLHLSLLMWLSSLLR